jgi:flagellar hook-associated protein 3 FlgL
MQISSKLFSEQQVRQFGKLNENIQNLQERVSSGQNILKASDDPIAAVKLSAAKEQEQILERFEKNVESAQSRLRLGDQTLNQSISVLTRMAELTTQAGNGIYDGFSIKAILTEMDQLSEVVVDLANTRDAQGLSLFSGFNTSAVAFEKAADGTITYNGDRGSHSLQISENMNVKTSIDGGSAFMRVQTPVGPKGVFDIINEVKNSIKSSGELSDRGAADANARLDFVLPEKSQNWSFSLSGTLGSTTINTNAEAGNLQKIVDDINLSTALTGVIATIEAATQSIRLSDDKNGTIALDNIEITGQDGATNDLTSKLKFTPIDEAGNSVGGARTLTDVDQLLGTNLVNIRAAMDHLSLKQTEIGAYESKANIQLQAIESRKLVVTKDMSKLRDADLAQLVTELQAQLTNRDAAQQAFAKIGQQSLFDFIR